MKKKLEQFVHKFFALDLPTSLILFNFVMIVGVAGGTFSLLFSVVARMSIYQIGTDLLAIFVTIICFYAANYKNRLQEASVAVTIVIAFILFPIMFFTGGGIYSGMPLWFILGFLFIFMLLEGPAFYVLCVIDFLVVILCMVVAYQCPELVTNIRDARSVYIDIGQSLVIVTAAVGGIIRFQSVVNKRIRQTLREQNEQLMERSKEAAQARQQALIANQTKNNFLANMSHEIRTPINSVLGMNEMILREAKSPRILEYATDIHASTRVLLGIINDILDFSRIESGKMEIIQREYRLSSLLHGVISTNGARAAEKGLKLKTEVAEHLPAGLYGDDVRIQQVLNNLLSNAVKYTHEGTVTLVVEGMIHKDGVTMHFEVRDTGIGIKEEDLERLFVAFERIEEERNRNIEGTGLGMNITTNLLNLMDSRLEVQSVYNRGSVFSFDLEQKITDKKPLGSFQESIRDESQGSHYQAKFVAPWAKVLVVDDNAINRKVFRQLLKNTQVEVTETDSGKGCLALVCQQRYDLIFLDHMMPGMDGIATFEQIKSMDESLCRDTPVIALTANAISGARESYLGIGFSDYLSKPLQSEELEEMMQRFLMEERAQPREERETPRPKQPREERETPRPKQPREERETLRLEPPSATAAAGNTGAPVQTGKPPGVPEKMIHTAEMKPEWLEIWMRMLDQAVQGGDLERAEQILESMKLFFFAQDETDCLRRVQEGLAAGDSGVIEELSEVLKIQ